MQYLMALAGATLVATALGWALAGRELGSMQAAFDARERFVANASHELRSPLTVIRTEADVTLSDPDATVDELRAMGREVIGAADEMDALLEGLMVLARSGRELPNRDYVDLAAAAVRDAARRVRPGGVRVRLELEPAGVSGERQLLERLAGQPDRERRPLQRAGRVRRGAHGVGRRRRGARRHQLRPGDRSRPSRRGWSSRSSAAGARGAAAPASGSRSCARWPRRTAGGSR